MAVTKIVSGGKTHGALGGCIDYVLQKGKTDEDLVFVQGPYGEDDITARHVYEAFLNEKKEWDKDSGRMYYHTIISFHQDEYITPREVLDFGIEYANRVFHDYQTLVVVHQDKAHLHVHFVVNSVSFEDGHKFHSSKHDLEEMKHETDRMCRERDLSITQKGLSFENEIIETGNGRSWDHFENELFRNYKGESYVLQCATACLGAMNESYDRDSFIRNMKERGWDTVWADNRKHITFSNEEGKKVRDSNISKKFDMDITKESLEALFATRDKPEIIPETEIEERDSEQRQTEEMEIFTEDVSEDNNMKTNNMTEKGGRDMDLTINMESGYKFSDEEFEEEQVEVEIPTPDIESEIERLKKTREEAKKALADCLDIVEQEQHEEEQKKVVHRHHTYFSGLGH